MTRARRPLKKHATEMVVVLLGERAMCGLVVRSAEWVDNAAPTCGRCLRSIAARIAAEHARGRC